MAETQIAAKAEEVEEEVRLTIKGVLTVVERNVANGEKDRSRCCGGLSR